MPILFNARHGAELTLKFAIGNLCRFGMMRAAHRMDHDLVSHYRQLRDADVGDELIRSVLADLEPFVLSLGTVDPDAQGYRFAESRDGSKSLGHLATLNIPLVSASLGLMTGHLERLRDRIMELDNQIRSGTFTRRCSRRDLIEIAKIVGPRSAWDTPAFDEARTAVRQRFGLSSNAFSKALDKIQSTAALATLIGVDRHPHKISEERLFWVAERWNVARSSVLAARPADRRGRRGFDFDQLQKHASIQQRLDQEMIEA